MNTKNQKPISTKEPLPVDDGNRYPDHPHLNEDAAELVPIEDAYDSTHEEAYQLLKKRLFTLNAYVQQGEDMSEPACAQILIDDRGALDAAVMVVWRLLKDDYGVVDRPAIVDAIARVLSDCAKGLSE